MKSAQLDRIPPYSEEAERAVLGAVLLGGGDVMDISIQKGLTSDSFYIGAHRLLFETLEDMNNRALPVDLLTVGEELRRKNREQEIGGDVFLETLCDDTPTSAHAPYYIEIIVKKHTARKIINAARAAVEDCYNGEDDEVDAILQRAEQAFFTIGEGRDRTMRKLKEIIPETMLEIEHIYQQKTGLTGIPTGYRDLDRQLLGFQPEDMIVLAARPSMGKTSLALNIAERITMGETSDRIPRPIAVYSLEMSNTQLIRRMVCCRGRVSAHKLASGYLSTQSYGELCAAAGQLLRADMILDDNAGMDMLELRSSARLMKRKYNIQMIIVDYLQLLHFSKFSRDGRQREVSAISCAMKQMAKELKIPILVLSQLSRATDQRDRLGIPKLSDLRDSGSIEQDADVVMLLRRPALYPDDPEHEDKRLTTVNVAKHRNGPTGEVKLNFDQEYMRFDDRLQYDHQEPMEGFEEHE